MLAEAQSPGVGRFRAGTRRPFPCSQGTPCPVPALTLRPLQLTDQLNQLIIDDRGLPDGSQPFSREANDEAISLTQHANPQNLRNPISVRKKAVVTHRYISHPTWFDQTHVDKPEESCPEAARVEAAIGNLQLKFGEGASNPYSFRKSASAARASAR
jgi:hypothetical protein